MRITDSMRTLTIERANAHASQRLADAARKAAAGAKVVTPSDDPVAYATTIRRSASVDSMRARSTVARGAADELAVAERALDGASELLTEARTLALQGSNETLTPKDRELLASRVRAIREEVLELANTRGTGGYVFAGTATDVLPFDASGSFNGNDTAIRVPISAGVAPRANASGAQAFTSAGGLDVFTELEGLASALDSGNVSTIRAYADTMTAAHDQIVAVQVESGLTMDRFRAMADLNEEASIVVEGAIARDIGATDMPGILTELSSATSAYERSLEVTRRLLAMPSLSGG